MGKKAKVWAEVSCVKHGMRREKETQSIVKVGLERHHLKNGCPKCKAEAKAEKGETA